MSVILMNDSSCVCGSGQVYSACCQPFHLQQSYPKTAEQLMRSRYVAFVLKLEDYLLQTWAKRTRPQSPLNLAQEATEWTGLAILAKKQGRAQDTKGWVKFKAQFDLDGQADQFIEKSVFERDAQGHWCYVKGQTQVS